MTGAFRPVDPAVMRRAAVEAERTAFKSALDAALRTLAAAALSAALSLGAWQAWRWATASPAFALNEIKFSGFCLAEVPPSTDPVRVMKYFRATWLAYQGLL